MPKVYADQDELQEIPLLETTCDQENIEPYIGMEKYNKGLDKHIRELSKTLNRINHRECRKWLPATMGILIAPTSTLLLIELVKLFFKLPSLRPAAYFIEQYGKAFGGYCGQYHPLSNLSLASSIFSNNAEKDCALNQGAVDVCRLSKPFYQFITEFIPETGLTCLERFNIPVALTGSSPGRTIINFIANFNNS